MQQQQQQQQQSQSQQPLIEYVFKILVVGDVGVGKTSAIQRYVHAMTSGTYKPTIGVDFALKVLQWDKNTTIRLQLWDIAGQERFGKMTRVYYKEAVGALVCYDITRVATFEGTVKWKQDIDSKVFLPDDTPIPCLLMANKCDLMSATSVKTQEEMDQFCKENQFVGWFETSAKENKGIDEAIKYLVQKVLEKNINPSRHHIPTDDNALTLLDSNEAPVTKKGGCC